MVYFIIKCLLSGMIIGVVSEVARRSPSLGALIVSLPLVSLLGILWLWRDTGDIARIADHAEFYVLVRPAVASDVSSFTCNASGRCWLLVKLDCWLRAYDVAVFGNRMGAGEIRDQPLGGIVWQEERFELWVAAAVLANNLLKIAALPTGRPLPRRKAA